MAETKRRAMTTGKYTSRKELVRAVWDLFYEGGTDTGIAREAAVSSGVVAKILRNGPRLRRRNPDVAKPTEAGTPLPEPVAPPVRQPVYPLVAVGREVVDAEGIALATAANETLALEVASAMNLSAAMTKGACDGASSPVAERRFAPEAVSAITDKPESVAGRGGRRVRRIPVSEPLAEEAVAGKPPANKRLAKAHSPESTAPVKAGAPVRRRRAVA